MPVVVNIGVIDSPPPITLCLISDNHKSNVYQIINTE